MYYFPKALPLLPVLGEQNSRDGSRRRSGKESPTKGSANKKSAGGVTGRRGRAREAVVDDESEESCSESEEEVRVLLRVYCVLSLWVVGWGGDVLNCCLC